MAVAGVADRRRTLRSRCSMLVCATALAAAALPAQASQPTATAATAASASAKAGVAFVTDLKGEHTLDGKRIALMAEIADGQSILVGPGGSLVVMFIQSGHEYSLTPGEYKVSGAAIQAVAGKSGATGKATRRITPWRPDAGGMVNISRSATASLRMRSVPTPASANGALGSSRPRALDPADTLITTLQPMLIFQAPSGKARVRIERDGKTIAQTDTEARQWSVTQKLEPGQSYRWVVGTGAEESAASFKVADADTLRRLTGLPSPRTFSDRLLRAATLQSVGATGEARAAFAALAAERPDLPELANLAR
ncbi:MAG: hypothetical protein SF172_09855 [Burkholderiales bacterium]|nr:hypothetical protein [Burkholderiales bacterium]